MAKLTGFMDYTRKTSTDVPPLERIENLTNFTLALGKSSSPGSPLHGLQRPPSVRRA